MEERRPSLRPKADRERKPLERGHEGSAGALVVAGGEERPEAEEVPLLVGRVRRDGLFRRPRRARVVAGLEKAPGAVEVCPGANRRPPRASESQASLDARERFWTGAQRFWEKHLTVPGDLDIYGVGTLGGPGVGLGFNRDVAWTLPHQFE